MTWMDYFKKFKPDITEGEIDYILWNETCYPFGDHETTMKQVEQFFAKTNLKYETENNCSRY